jgi:hypothetical protein
MAPYFNKDLVELPITPPQDSTLFTIGIQTERPWLEKAQFLRERGGIALLITHPDYILERRPREAYRRLLEAFRDDATAWRPLPPRREQLVVEARGVAARALQRGWTIVGPAVDAGRVVYR